MKTVIALISGVAIGITAMWFGPHFVQNLNQPYAGQEQRKISSLSAKDIEQLEKGAGWGLAKPAELNGYPGPAHVLELEDKLSLNSDQKSRIQASFDAMNKRARDIGLELIEAEAALDAAFAAQTISNDDLGKLLEATESARAALREVHLSAHLEITPLLNETQKTRYVELRGYANGHNGHEGH